MKKNLATGKQLENEGNMQTATAPNEEWVLVTPPLADEWLQRNDDNRRMSPSRVLKFAEDMEAGRWAQYHPHGIAFDRNGRLIDGQHRLKAVEVSGVSIWMRVTKDLEPRMHIVFDLGTPRSTANMFQRAGITSGAQIAGIAAMLHMIDTKPDSIWTSTGYPSKTWQLEFVQQHQDQLDKALKAAHQVFRATRIPRTQYGVLYLLADRHNLLGYWKDWHSGLVSGAGLQKGDPRLSLRNYFANEGRMREGYDHWTRQKRLAIIVKAFKAYVEGQSVRLYRFERNNLPMPTLDDVSVIV